MPRNALQRVLAAFVLVFGATVLEAGAQGPTIDDIRQMSSAGLHQEAIVALRAYLERNPGHVEGQLLEGVILTREGRTGEAIEVFRKLVELQPGLPETHNNLAVLYATQRRYREARDSLQQAIDLQPDYDTAHENLGDIYAKLAALSYLRAHELNPGNGRARDKARIVERTFDIGPSGSAGVPAPAPSAPEPVPAAVATRVAAVAPSRPEGECHDTGAPLPPARAEEVRAWLEDRGVAARSVPGTHRRIVNYKVYLPPLGSRDAAMAEIARLEGAGIRDVSRIPRGEQENGIALGVYGAEENATRRVGFVSALGWQPLYAPRYRVEPARRIVTAPGALKPAVRAAAAARFPDVAFASSPCN